MMLQTDTPEDYVIATAKQYSVGQLCTLCFEMIGRPITFRGSGISEEGVDAAGNVVVQVSTKYFRPTEVETLLGDATKAKTKLGWIPDTSFKELVHEMMQFDMQQVGKELPATAADIVKRQDEYC